MLIVLPHSGHLISFISEQKRLTNFSLFILFRLDKQELCQTQKPVIKKDEVMTGYLEKEEIVLDYSFDLG